MRRPPQHPVAVAANVAWQAIRQFVIVSKIQLVVILGMMMVWFTRSSIFAHDDGGGSSGSGSGGRRQHLRGGSSGRRPLILVHSDSQPFVSYRSNMLL